MSRMKNIDQEYIDISRHNTDHIDSTVHAYKSYICYLDKISC